jgi:hypothetical protein
VLAPGREQALLLPPHPPTRVFLLPVLVREQVPALAPVLALEPVPLQTVVRHRQLAPAET